MFRAIRKIFRCTGTIKRYGAWWIQNSGTVFLTRLLTKCNLKESLQNVDFELRRHMRTTVNIPLRGCDDTTRKIINVTADATKTLLFLLFIPFFFAVNL